MQVQETYCAVVIFLTYWVLESGEGFFSLAFFFLQWSILGTNSLGVL